ncbi:glycoside hydrolase family 65 protein [Caulobacter flavus]|uniref:Glycoside hydrolase family 65 protein n=1 Tax=Caulobacter flavus TaxID=1679497 RepID=A0A2N5CKB9_9CAUL|nr:glycoside hydrolase family 65 protein [Caulobacter flavus]PLR05796.1 glycoside hydrolase family 65 protein [Caulobacter flavus]
MPAPASPPSAKGPLGNDLPAYLSNGLIGLRLRETVVHSGMALVSGFTGVHPERGIEAIAQAPFPFGLDLAVDGVWASDAPHAVEPIDQAHDFATGELVTRALLRLGDRVLSLRVSAFCSRSQPTIVVQELVVEADGPCRLEWRSFVDVRGLRGRLADLRLDTPGEAKTVGDGALCWEGGGGSGRCGVAFASFAPEGSERSLALSHPLAPAVVSHAMPLVGEKPVRLLQIVSLVPGVLHQQPDYEAVRLLARALETGFDRLRQDNRACWKDLWLGRIRLVGAEPRWQALADAAFYYLNASVHGASPCSTSIFGLASWHDYHYYYGHVMWDIDAFAIEPLSLLQPQAARALLDFRSRGLVAARNNAKLMGREGLQFPWEAAPLTYEEAAPGGGTGAWREDHVTLHVARAFAQYAAATADARFADEDAWPVLAGVADWIVSRVTLRDEGYAFLHHGGPAERAEAVDNDALTIMAAKVVLGQAQAAAAARGLRPPEIWGRVAEGLAPPMRSDGAIAAHDGFVVTEEKGATPSPLLGLYPYGYRVDPDTERKTLAFYLGRWEDYVGSPMLSALYGAWAAMAGDRRLALRLLDEGYGRYVVGRFQQTLEYRLDRMPDGAPAGPFFANIAGFLSSLLFGFTGLRIGRGEPKSWSSRPAFLPAGWQAIEVDRLWIGGRAMRLRARHGEPAILDDA